MKNIPKGQFLRLRRICSNTVDYITNANIFIKYFCDRGYDQDIVENAAKQALKTTRLDLLKDTKRKEKQESQSILVTTWHPKLQRFPSILRKHFHLLQNDNNLRNIFTSAPLVAFRRQKSIRNFIVRNDIKQRDQPSTTTTSPCGKCKKTCHLISNSPIVRNSVTGQQVKSVGGNCKSKNVVYAVRCKQHDLLYIGHTGDELSVRMSKHRYDLHKRPENNELTKHLAATIHDFETDIDVTIIANDIGSCRQRELKEDKLICKLGTLQPNGLNLSLHQYGEDMYSA